jgi:hypothetical protein
MNFDSLVFTTGKEQFIFCEAIRAMTTRSCDLTIYSVFFLRARAEAEGTVAPARDSKILVSRFCCLKKVIICSVTVPNKLFSPFWGRCLQFRGCRNMYKG